MATSGSTNWNMITSQIIDEAGENLGFVKIGGTASALQYVSCRRTLNNMAKSFNAPGGKNGVRLWTTEHVVKQFTSAADVVSNNSVNYKCQLPHTSAATDEPGVGANSSLYWVITEDTAGGAWALATAYATPAAFDEDSNIIGIESAFYRDSTGSDVTMEIISYDEYQDIRDKDKTGTMKYLVFRRSTISASRVFIYPPTNLLTDVLHYVRIRKLEDFDKNNNDPDFPQHWYRTLVLGLTWELRLKFPYLNVDQENKLFLQFKESYSDSKSSDFEQTDGNFIKPAYGSRRNRSYRGGAYRR